MKDNEVFVASNPEKVTSVFASFSQEKVRGSHQFYVSTKAAIAAQAKLENRTFNNMLEELARRALAAQ